MIITYPDCQVQFIFHTSVLADIYQDENINGLIIVMRNATSLYLSNGLCSWLINWYFSHHSMHRIYNF